MGQHKYNSAILNMQQWSYISFQHFKPYPVRTLCSGIIWGPSFLFWKLVPILLNFGPVSVKLVVQTCQSVWPPNWEIFIFQSKLYPQLWKYWEILISSWYIIRYFEMSDLLMQCIASCYASYPLAATSNACMKEAACNWCNVPWVICNCKRLLYF